MSVFCFHVVKCWEKSRTPLFFSTASPLVFRISLLFPISLPRTLFLFPPHFPHYFHSSLPGWSPLFWPTVSIQRILGLYFIFRFAHIPCSSSACCYLCFSTFLCLPRVLFPNLFSSAFSDLFFPLVPGFFSLFFHFPLVCSPFIFLLRVTFCFILLFFFTLRTFSRALRTCYPRPAPNRKSRLFLFFWLILITSNGL